ncbi:hypothetical protein IJJ27_04350 [bacterium]|nr:hypothetical protein [bacterium]
MKIKYNKNAKTFHESVNVNEKRKDEILNQLDKIYQELPSPFTVNDFLDTAYSQIELKNSQEVAFLAYALESIIDNMLTKMKVINVFEKLIS